MEPEQMGGLIGIIVFVLVIGIVGYFLIQHLRKKMKPDADVAPGSSNPNYR